MMNTRLIDDPNRRPVLQEFFIGHFYADWLELTGDLVLDWQTAIDDYLSVSLGADPHGQRLLEGVWELLGRKLSNKQLARLIEVEWMTQTSAQLLGFTYTEVLKEMERYLMSIYLNPTTPRTSHIIWKHDSAGAYEMEIFDCPNPKRLIVCLHGRGVRRWDGEAFFYAVAEHYADSAVLLVDQFQHEEDTVVLNPLPILAARVNGLIAIAKRLHPGVPIVAIAHSMGCGVATRIEVSELQAMVLVTPGGGSPLKDLVEKYGADIMQGKIVRNLEGAKVGYTAAFLNSMEGIDWPTEYRRLIKTYAPIYVFEGGDDEIIGNKRFALRDIPFTKYFILEGAGHNLAGAALTDFFDRLDPLLAAD